MGENQKGEEQGTSDLAKEMGRRGSNQEKERDKYRVEGRGN